MDLAGPSKTLRTKLEKAGFPSLRGLARVTRGKLLEKAPLGFLELERLERELARESLDFKPDDVISPSLLRARHVRPHLLQGLWKDGVKTWRDLAGKLDEPSVKKLFRSKDEREEFLKEAWSRGIAVLSHEDQIRAAFASYHLPEHLLQALIRWRCFSLEDLKKFIPAGSVLNKASRRQAGEARYIWWYITERKLARKRRST